ncbi:hypothetical protein Rt10032_c03g1607 [Rhodotorula toruloides]|uniref:Myosin-binding domain-containing protein n=1 Tax=Rhodotorula toruloides TaxID=5286 RepID=A0A511KB43_RHOTO|nr:hypothetical protein Rt10032_c03g1607 [Rhodotorula toruloides]
MAEAVAYAESPIADYLRQNGEGDEFLKATPSTGPSRHPSTSTSTRTPSPSTPSRPAPPRRTQTRHAASIERVKYALATSALLSAKLGDALQLYPPLEVLEKQRAAAGRVKGKGKGPLRKGAVTVKKADWPSGWDSVGQGVLERGVLGNAQAALKGLAGASSLFLKKSGEAPAKFDAAAGTLEEDEPRTTPQDSVLASVERFIAASQELDLRAAAALTAIKELECIAHGLGLSDPLPPISRIEARMHAPSSSPSSSPPPNPPPLRALALRTSLSELLSSALSALSTSTADLNALLPRDSPLLQLQLTAPTPALSPSSSPTRTSQASLSELLRHDTRARLERDEVERWEGASASGGSRPTSVVPGEAAAFDPFHPTDSTFGGIDRRVATGDVDLTPLLLISLQDAFETLHDTRRGVIWRLLESLSHAQSDTAWNAIGGLVDSAAGRVGEVASEVGEAHEMEFGTSKPEGEGKGTEGHRSERRRRSGYYSRTVDEVEVDFPQLGKPASPVGTGLTPTTAKARGDALARLNGVPKATGAPLTPSNLSHVPPRSGTPVSYANFAPSAAPSPADNSLASHTHALSLLVRSIQAKIRVVTSDTALLATLRAEEAEERREKVLRTWEGIGREVETLRGEWRAGGDALRRALGLELGTEHVEVEEEEEVEVAHDGGNVRPDKADEDEQQDVDLNQGAIYATLDSSGQPPTADESLATRQALLDATLSLSLLPPTSDAAAEEKVFEAVAGPPSSSRIYGPDGSKLSRDERIRRMREAREALQRGRESLESSPTKERGSIGGTSGGMEEQQKMVGELREVLRELNRDKGRDTPEPPRPATATPITPPRSTTGLPPPAKASPAPPMLPKLPPFPTGPRFAPSPPVSPQRSAFAPPPPPSAVCSPPPFQSSPTTARSPLPAINRPPPVPPSYAPSASPPLPPSVSTRSPPPPPPQQQTYQRVKRPSVVQTV